MRTEHGRHIAFVLLTGIGDVVHGLPVANALKRAGLASRITWIAEPVPAHIVRPHPAVDRVVVYHKKNGLLGIWQLARELRNRNIDIAFNFNVYAKSIWPTVLTRAPRRVGFDRRRSNEGVWLFANEHLRGGTRAHTQDMFLEFLDVLGLNADTERKRGLQWRLGFTRAELDAQTRFFEPLRERPVIAVVPASANWKKDWPVARYIGLISALQHDYNANVVLVGGPSEHEAELSRQIVAGLRKPPVMALGDDVRRMMWLVAGSDLVIAPDTGPLHIARASDVPVIGLFGATNPWRVGPYRKYEDLWIDRYTDGSPDPTQATAKLGRMEMISVQDVLDRVRHAFEHYRVSERSGRPA